MYADLNAAGTTPADRDALILSRWYRNGTIARSLEHSLRSHVGIGSEAHCLFGRARPAAVTSSCVTCLKLGEDTVGRREARCCGAGSRRTDIGDFLVKETVKIPGADVVATL